MFLSQLIATVLKEQPIGLETLRPAENHSNLSFSRWICKNVNLCMYLRSPVSVMLTPTS